MRITAFLRWTPGGFFQWALTLAVLITVFVGCDEGNRGYDGPLNTCEVDGDCPSGSGCDASLSKCVVTGVAFGRRYYLKVLPPLDAEVSEQMFAVELDGNGDVPMPLEIYPPSDTVFQEVRTQGGEKSIYARVLFTEHLETFVDDPVRVLGVTAVEEKQFYVTGLIPGAQRYGIKVIPLGNEAVSYPPRYYDEVEVTSSGGLFDSEGLKLEYLEVEPAYAYVLGMVKRGNQFVNNVEVRARDPISGRVLSTTSTTGIGCPVDSICGQFIIGLAPGVTSFSLEMVRQSEPWYPAVTVPDISIEDLLEGDGTVEVIDLETIDLEEPLGEVVKVQGRVEAPVLLADGSSVMDGAPGCQIVFESDDVAGGRAVRYGKTDQTGEIIDGAGYAGVDLFPGLYDVTVIPPAPSNDSLDDYAVLGPAEPLDVTGTMDAQVFTLERRPMITGRVMGEGEALRRGTVLAEPEKDTSSDSRSNTASIENDGTFSIWLDEDSYRLTAEAPQESGYAFGVTRVPVAEVCSGEREEPCALDLNLAIPFVARALLVLQPSTDESGVGLAGATVEWYEIEEAEETTLHLVGRSVSDEEGRVIGLLPPTIQSVEHQP